MFLATGIMKDLIKIYTFIAINYILCYSFSMEIEKIKKELKTKIIGKEIIYLEEVRFNPRLH